VTDQLMDFLERYPRSTAWVVLMTLLVGWSAVSPLPLP
jgi:hypothetical protein